MIPLWELLDPGAFVFVMILFCIILLWGLAAFVNGTEDRRIDRLQREARKASKRRIARDAALLRDR